MSEFERSELDIPDNTDSLWAEFDFVAENLPAKPDLLLLDKLSFIRPITNENGASVQEQNVATDAFTTFVDNMMLANIRNVRRLYNSVAGAEVDNLLFQHTISGKEYLALSLYRRDEPGFNRYGAVVFYDRFDQPEDAGPVATYRYGTFANDKVARMTRDEPVGYAVKLDEVEGLYDLVKGANVFMPPAGHRA